MDSVELARQLAADLHAKAVARGADPSCPYDFVLAEAAARGIDIERTARGGAMLDRGRATFIAADRLILHENAGTAFDQAFLVAHEIGHDELGDDVQVEPPHEIDPTRSAEPSPVGIDRVIDYGRRQRREVQMDLFAREFLLPRGWLRKLHLQDGLTASHIAELVGAPFAVVAQQLLDALLLPAIPPSPQLEEVTRPPNPLQAAAAQHRGPAFLLEAGPGTGKTQTLAARVQSLLAAGVDPRGILLLTFSNKAAAEMAARIAATNDGTAAAMWIGTFHAFGLDLIHRFYAELEFASEPRLMDRTEAVELLEDEFPRLGLSEYRDLYNPVQIIVDILAAISRAKDEVVGAGRYRELAETMLANAVIDADRLAARRALEVARVYDAYESLKKAARCVDFGDLVFLPVALLEGNNAIRTELQKHYSHVLVDEYQDVNRSSIRLLTALTGDGGNLWAVGDAKQSIYRFRGASSFNMMRFGSEDFRGGTRGRLKLNYRSTAEIVATFSAFARTMKAGGPDGSLEADRASSGHNPELRTAERAEQQTVAVADTIDEMRHEGYSYSDQAVLCTGNEKLSVLAQELERMGVPVLFLGSLFERSEVKDLLALLSLLTDRRASGLVRVACMAEFQLSIGDVAAVLDSLRSVDVAPGQWLQSLPAFAGLSPEAATALESLAAAVSGFDQRSSPWEVLAAVLLDRTRIAARIAQSTDVPERTRGIAIWQVMNFIRGQPAARGLPITRLLERIRRLVRLGDDRDLRQLPAAAQSIDAVRLMTIHGAKGLEFPIVHVTGLNANAMPGTPRPPACLPPDGMIEGGAGTALEIFNRGEIEERECLFYVALSRARDRLMTYAPTKTANGHRRPLSPFIDVLGPLLTRRNVSPARELPRPPEGADVALAVDGRLSFGAHQIALYESCPRRFLYTHVLRIGGRRMTTAFMQMHDAVRSVYQGIVNGIIDQEGLDLAIADALAANGLADHGYFAQYHALAVSMVRYFVAIRHGQPAETITDIRLTLGDEEIVVRADDVLVATSGARTLRHIRTGHQRASHSDGVAAAAFMLAAQQEFPGATVELVYLADQVVLPLELSSRLLQNRRDKLLRFLSDIRRGRFPAQPSIHTCPGCPAFFVCGETPAGTLRKKFI